MTFTDLWRVDLGSRRYLRLAVVLFLVNTLCMLVRYGRIAGHGTWVCCGQLRGKSLWHRSSLRTLSSAIPFDGVPGNSRVRRIGLLAAFYHYRDESGCERVAAATSVFPR